MELALAYDQTAAGAGMDRHGLGEGFGLGKAFVDPEGGGTLHTASGGSFPLQPGDTTGTGLKRYLLKDLAFREAPGTLPDREGLEGAAREYRWVLTYEDGRKNFFSPSGSLIAEEDAFANQTAYVWEEREGQHRLHRAVDAWGQAVTFDYGTENQVTVTSPVRSDGRQPQIVLTLDGGRLTAVSYPEDQEAKLAWDYTPDGLPGRLLTSVEGPTGAVTRISYAQPHGFPVTSSLKVTDREGKNLTAERTFTLGAEGEYAGHDFTGRGQFTSTDDLFDSADADYRYVTELSDGRSTVRSVYNSLHLLKERTASLIVQGELKPVRTQELQYEGEREGGQAPPPASGLPANYAKPVRATVTVRDPATGRSRTTTETARFDGHGREVERTDVTGATTVTEYDPTAVDTGTGTGTGRPAGYGLPLRITVTGSGGAQSITEHTLSEDRRSITAVKQSVKNNGADQPAARTVTRFTVNGHGEVTQKTVTWAEGAEPEGTEGPDQVSETYGTAADTAAHTLTSTVKSAAGVSSQTTDLVTGQVVKATDTEGRTAEASYDDAGRVITQKAPGGPNGLGLVTTASYTPTTVSVSTPGKDGRPHVTVEERDLLGRTVKVSDNVRGGELTGDPAARTLQSVQFEDEGRTTRVTDRAGRTTVTTSDDLGRPVKTVAPNGMTQLALYADAATADTSTVTTLTLPAGQSDPAQAVMTATETRDSAGRTVAAGTSAADGTEQSGTTRSYDGLGRVKEAVSRDVAVTPSYGTAGITESTTLTPRNTGTFPGEKITTAVSQDLTGSPVVKKLTPGQDAEGRSGTFLLRDEAGRITEERRPDGKKTTFTYTPGGQVKDAVSPSGIRTSYTYDGKTGQVLGITVTSPDGRTTEKTGYTYDPHTGAATSVFDPDDPGATRITYTYDADGNVTDVTYPDGTAVRQKFGDNGQLQQVTDAAGLTTFYTCNPDGTLSKAVQHERNDTGSPVKASVAYTYDGLGRITKTERGNGVVTDTQFTATSQIKHEKTSKDGSLLTEAAYTYDAHNNLTQRTDTRPEARADGTPGPAVTTTTRYGYDAYNRLISSEVLNAAGQQQTATRYTLNVSGDVVKTETTPRTAGPGPAVTEHGIDTSGRLTTLTADGRQHQQDFDTEGNLTTSHQGTVWTYNLHNQPLSMTAPDGSVTRYTYWADGTRATQTETPRPPADGTGSSGEQERVTVFHYSPDGALLNDTHTSPTAGQQEGTAEAVTASYLLAGTRHARTLTGQGAEQAAPTGAGYLIADRHGNTTALTSHSGDVSQAWQYTDYGQHASHTGTPWNPHDSHLPGSPAGAARQPFTYAGEYTGRDGTQYLKTRIYDPATKRFTASDRAPQHNRYQAFGANPVTNIDPQGTTEFPDWANWLIWGVTLAAAAITTAATAGGGAFALAVAGLASDVVSYALDAAALALRHTRINNRDEVVNALSWTAAAVGFLGLSLSIGSVKSARSAAAAARHADAPVPHTPAPASSTPAGTAPAPAPPPLPAARPASAPAGAPASPPLVLRISDADRTALADSLNTAREANKQLYDTMLSFRGRAVMNEVTPGATPGSQIVKQSKPEVRRSYAQGRESEIVTGRTNAMRAWVAYRDRAANTAGMEIDELSAIEALHTAQMNEIKRIPGEVARYVSGSGLQEAKVALDDLVSRLGLKLEMPLSEQEIVDNLLTSLATANT
ncbi:RHS repeat-associated core domain-containing protein [Streptomyces sp. NPDC008121]|uniref:RHS repeat-associated core domain-containing protein n=1 Tax=Streptomyces sp. NPDC008121 TaxID=3364809 RepID=UPI0036EC0AC6